jgi:hypothetical protein
MAALYALFLGLLFWSVPGLFINIFGSGDRAQYAAILDKARPIMNVLAVFFTLRFRSGLWRKIDILKN